MEERTQSGSHEKKRIRQARRNKLSKGKRVRKVEWTKKREEQNRASGRSKNKRRNITPSVQGKIYRETGDPTGVEKKNNNADKSSSKGKVKPGQARGRGTEEKK